ncbi:MULTISPECIES: SDR family oxidoreductase [Pseudomonas]|uniref:SDR family oxidoreductase n=1 Tax=Pseudomonas sp. WC2401 TaxID=3234143 RepID=A0AB39X2K6_9PSED|nr:SDR family oxidoreductase [Pseudomonas fragi]MBM1205550.1 SDR family oxidoreductase [Pseudomonas fragi]MDE4513143.1 SDR family oxidoreductase [Pseudomonas fragi]NNB07633.1 SDR family oxidoreductase [Pseudomonas fragi]NNB14209.1 SDR family oxidoreductase [Pseudomonas fragi]NNB19433.1 SDR family oxidoreductase [Pseudomonas fragi]
MTSHKPTVLITGATGQIGGDTLRNLQADQSITLVAAVRSHAKAQPFAAQGIRTVIMDFDQEHTLAPALEGIDRALLVTGYTVDMLRQSKAFIDQAKKSGVQHMVHLGACGRDDTTIGHWAWHQFVERYIEWSGFSFTHLRPECFMQNLLSYDGTRAVINGVIEQYTGDARFSWVDGEDVARVAAQALLHPDRHAGQTYRLGYDVQSYGDIAAIMSRVLGQPFRYDAQSPDVFVENMRAAGAEMAYMNCVHDNFTRMAARQIPGVEETFDNFSQITGRQPVSWEDFVEKHRKVFAY